MKGKKKREKRREKEKENPEKRVIAMSAHQLFCATFHSSFFLF